MSTPKFSEKSELVRYVDEVNRLKDRRPAVATFLPDPPSDHPANDHLSVNSLEVESIKEIAAYHRWKWQNNRGKVALCVHKVHVYNDAANKSDVPITYNRELSNWQFTYNGSKVDAYKHRPVKAYDNPLGSPSHSGVEFARALKEHNAGKFARRMTGKKFHLI